MSIKYLEFSVKIHGLNIKSEDSDEGIEFLSDWIKKHTLMGLMSSKKKLFDFRNAFDSDVEVEIEYLAGK